MIRQWSLAGRRAAVHRPTYVSRTFTTASSSTASSTELQRGEGCSKLQIGETYHNFRLVQRTPVPEYNVEALELVHDRTKARYLHIDAADANNVFSVMFKTPPYNSNGVPHILEHTVLCGSQQYPVRDPFFNMLKRSLNTFMNAMTAYDHTMYPFATTNAEDWKNLLSVYCDAAFFPHLHRLDFLQEGHRLEIDSESKELVRKGVVLNEMKGVMSDSDNLFATRLQQELLKGSIYGNVSGGDPSVIPSLTYEQLTDFHAQHYHPTNSMFYTYGDLPLTDHLQYLDEKVLSRFEYNAPSEAIRVSTDDFSIKSDGKKPEMIVMQGPTANMGEGGDNTKFATTKLLPVPSTDAFNTFVLRVVGYLLTNGPSSELYKALIDTGLAQDFAVGTGFDTSTYYTSFGIALEGLSNGQASVDDIEKAIETTLHQVVANGFDSERVDALLHQLELSIKHISSNFGLNLMHGVSSIWAHDGDVASNLQVNPVLSELRSKMKQDPRFLESYISTYLLSNDTKSVRLFMEPNASYVQSLEDKEKEELQQLHASLSEEDVLRIQKESNELETYQKAEQPVECLPTLNVQDIPTVHKENLDDIVYTRVGEKETPVEFVQVPTTNEVCYLRLLFDIQDANIPFEYHAYLPLLASVVGALGTSSLSHDALQTAVQNCSGGISFAPQAHPDLSDAANHSQQQLLVSSMCLPHKLDDNLQLLTQVLTDTQFTDDRNLAQLRILLQSSAANAANSISSSGAPLAGRRARLGLTASAPYQEVYGGLTHVQLLQQWARASDAELRDLALVLEKLSKVVFSPQHLRISVVAESTQQTQVEAALDSQLLRPLYQQSDAPSLDTSVDPFVSSLLTDLRDAPTNAYFGFPISVNFVAQALPSVSFAHDDHVPLTVLAQLMSSCVVHQDVRETGGAYGSMAGMGEGAFSFASHYDPQTWATIKAYERALNWARDGGFSDRDVSEAQLSVFASVDAPQTPSSKGKTSFMRGISNDMRQKRREQYLSVTRQSLMDVAQKHFNDDSVKQAKCAIIGKQGGEDEFEQAGFHLSRLGRE